MTRWLVFLCVGMALAAVSGYQSEILEWRKQRETRLKTESGWLSLVGLFRLDEGANPFGKAETNKLVLPDGPPQAGSFDLHGDKVTVTMDGKTKQLSPESDEPVKVGRVSLYLIKRGDKMFIRAKDPQSPARVHFAGIESYPINEAYRVTATWVPQPRKIPILNIIGITEESENPGYAVFHLNGKELRLYPIFETPGAKELFYIFKDQTTGKETYPAGRFFYTDLPKDGKVVLDFNKAYNPPCAFTDYATCPLPPKENVLPVRIEAGEKNYHTPTH